MSSDPNRQLDPYTAKAENNDVTPQTKITDLHGIIKNAPMCMLTTRAADGELHSRAMVSCTPDTATQVKLIFIANNASHKFDEIENDTHVNVSFSDQSTTNWASFSGKARISQDQATIDKYWNTTVAAYFGDLEDGKHTGKSNDPRVRVIEVNPNEIRYWLSTQSSITRAANHVVSAVTGNAAAPGELRTITKAEIQLVAGLNTA